MIFINDGADDIPPNSIINLTGITKQDNGQYYLNADKPDSAANFLLAITGNETVKADKKGSCQPIGPVFLMAYDTADGTPANEQNWGADNGTFKLKKNFGGGNWAVIGADTENEIALVMVTGKVIFTGKNDAEIAAGATSGTVSIYAGTLGSETDTGDNVTIGINRGEIIAISKWVTVERHNSGWEVYPKECS